MSGAVQSDSAICTTCGCTYEVVKEQKAPDTVGDTRSAVPDLPPETLPLASFVQLGNCSGCKEALQAFLQAMPPYLTQLNKKLFLNLCANTGCC